MVSACQFDNPGPSASRFQHHGPPAGVVKAPVERPAQPGPRPAVRNDWRHADPGRDDVGHAVEAPLGTLPYIVNERCHDKVRVAVPLIEKESRRRRPVHHVAGMLGEEQVKKGWRKPLASQGKVDGRRAASRVQQLADPVTHQTSNS